MDKKEVSRSDVLLALQGSEKSAKGLALAITGGAGSNHVQMANYQAHCLITEGLVRRFSIRGAEFFELSVEFRRDLNEFQASLDKAS